MKYQKYLLASALAVVAAVGCDDDGYLEEDPKTIYTVENAFEKSSQVDATVSRAYYILDKLHGWDNFFFAQFDDTYDYRACTVLGGQGTDVIGGDGQLMHEQGTFSDWKTQHSDNDDIYKLWNDLYELAAQANMAIYGADLVTWGSDSEKNAAVAQARFMRGWAYLRLAECFGGVPIIPEYSDVYKEDYVRESRETVYEFAIEDLEFAAEQLPTYPEEDGRVAQGATNHYLAEAYLGLGIETEDSGCYSKAIAAANKVIAAHPLMTERFGVRANPSDKGTDGVNPLDPSLGVDNYKADGDVFFDLFQKGNYDYSEGNTEGLLVAQCPSYDNYSVTGGVVYMFGVTCNPGVSSMTWSNDYADQITLGSTGPFSSSDFDGLGACAYNGGASWGIVGSTDYSDEVVWQGDFADDIRNNQLNRCDLVVTDPRSSLKGQVATKDMLKDPASLMRVSAKITSQDGWGFTPGHHQVWGSNYACMYGRDWYIARSAETYLLLAEAQLRSGNNAAATEAVNTLRRRAQASYMYSSVDIYDILDERARELAWEEHRWPTLLRMGSTKTGKNEVMGRQLQYTMLANDLGYDAGSPDWILFPIPLKVINMNKGAEMEQNVGW